LFTYDNTDSKTLGKPDELVSGNAVVLQRLPRTEVLPNGPQNQPWFDVEFHEQRRQIAVDEDFSSACMRIGFDLDRSVPVWCAIRENVHVHVCTTLNR
jgi:hypothetical protein